MTSTQKLVEFMLEKNRLIKAYTGIDYILTADIKELHAWPERKAKQFFKDLVVDDTDCCPWCVRFKCPTCTYKKRHGECNKDLNSRYSKIKAKMRQLGQPFETGIVDVPGIETLIKMTIRETQDEKK